MEINYQTVYVCLRCGKHPVWSNNNQKRATRNKAKKFIIQDGVLHYVSKSGLRQWITEPEQQLKIIKACHADKFTVLVGCLKFSIHTWCSVTCVSRTFTTSVWDLYHLGQTIGHVNIVDINNFLFYANNDNFLFYLVSTCSPVYLWKFTSSKSMHCLL